VLIGGIIEDESALVASDHIAMDYLYRTVSPIDDNIGVNGPPNVLCGIYTARYGRNVDQKRFK